MVLRLSGGGAEYWKQKVKLFRGGPKPKGKKRIFKRQVSHLPKLTRETEAGLAVGTKAFIAFPRFA